MTTGTIKKVVADRGFGFITAADTKEYFFHRNSLDSTLDFDRLNGGEAVKFEIEDSPTLGRSNDGSTPARGSDPFTERDGRSKDMRSCT